MPWHERLAVLFLLAGLSLPASAPPSHQPAATAQISGRNINQDYILALTTADEFLEAWRHREVPKAFALLSPAAQKRYGNKEHFMLYLSGISNPHHQSYEVSNGRVFSRGHIRFLVRLYENYTAQPWHGKMPPVSTIVLVQTGRWEWKVDHVPAWPWPHRKSF